MSKFDARMWSPETTAEYLGLESVDALARLRRADPTFPSPQTDEVKYSDGKIRHRHPRYDRVLIDRWQDAKSAAAEVDRLEGQKLAEEITRIPASTPGRRSA